MSKIFDSLVLSSLSLLVTILYSLINLIESFLDRINIHMKKLIPLLIFIYETYVLVLSLILKIYFLY